MATPTGEVPPALRRCYAMLAVLFALMATQMAMPAAAEDAPVPLPRPRPAETATPLPPELPRSRPDPAAGVVRALPGTIGPPAPPQTQLKGLARPELPPRVYQSACPAVLLGQVEAKALPPIADGQCVAQSPLSVTGVLANGRMVPVSGDVETDCGMASALPEWVASIDSYLLSRENTRIAELVVGTSYMCRGVNGGSEGNLSFHAFANALDIVGFKLEDGRFVTVEGGWANALSAEGRLLRFAHDSACASFTTVLGPEANAEHQDHLHLDLGCHGKACTARLCE